MIINSFETLIIFMCIFGVVGAFRGTFKEMITLSILAITIIALFFGANQILAQLPLRSWAALQSFAGYQSASNTTAAHPLGAPASVISLWICVISIIILAYVAGSIMLKSKINSLQSEKNEKRLIKFGGFFVGLVNGAIIAIILFSQKGINLSLNVQLPSEDYTHSIIAPIMLIALLCIVIVVIISTHKTSGKEQKQH